MRESGLTYVVVIAALLVVGFLSVSMVKMASQDRITNVHYYSSEIARTTARSGLVDALSRVESVRPMKDILPVLQSWYEASLLNKEIPSEAEWLVGDEHNWKKLSSNCSYRVKIVGFDPNAMNIQLQSESKGNGAASVIALYHIDGLELRKSAYPLNALQADGGVQEGDCDRIEINGSTSIRWGGEWENSSFNSRVLFNGAFRTDGADKPFKCNGFYDFKGPSYFQTLQMLSGSTAKCYDIFCSRGAKPAVVSPGKEVSFEELGLLETADPAVEFHKDNVEEYAIDISDVSGGSAMNSLWENTPASAKYKGKYLVVHARGSEWAPVFKNDGIPFKYSAIVLVDGQTSLTTFYESAPSSQTVLYVENYPYGEQIMTDVANFRGYIYVNATSGQNKILTFGRKYSTESVSDLNQFDLSQREFAITGSLYSSDKARLRFNGMRVKYSGDVSGWTKGNGQWMKNSTIMIDNEARISVETAPEQILKIQVGNKDFYPGKFSVTYDEALIRTIVDDGIISIPPRGNEPNTNTLVMKAGIKKLSTTFLSQWI